MRQAWQRWAPIVLGLALALALPLAAGTAQAQDEADHESQLVLTVENEAREDREINVTVEGATTWARNVTVPARDTWQTTIDAELGRHEIRFVFEDTLRRSEATARADTRGCRGTTATDVRFTGDGGVHLRGARCEGTLIAFEQLVDEARQAREADAEGEPVQIPVPRDASEGEYRMASNVYAPDWANASSFPFRWIPNATFADAWGNEVQGTELVLGPTERSEVTSGALAFRQSISAQIENRVRYADDPWRPIAETSGTTLARATPTGTSSQIIWNVGFDPDASTTDCLMRNDRQGGELEPGQQAAPLCPASRSMANMTWWTGETERHRGLTSIPLYGLDDPEDPSRLVKAVWAHGIPHPVHVAYLAEGPEGSDRLALNLSHHQPEGAPLDQMDPLDQKRPSIETGPQRPLEGPSLVDDARVPFPLEEAVDAARSDPTLTELQALLQDDAVLAAAHLRPDARTDTGEVRELDWLLAFTTDGQGPVFVTCSRPTNEDATGPMGSATNCDETDDDRYGREVHQLGPDDLASRSIAWDVALDRWALMDPANASAPVTQATYRPVLAEDADVRPDDRFGYGIVVVGTAGGPDSGPAESEEAPTLVHLDAETGRTERFRTGVKEVGGLTPTDRQLATAAPAGPGGDGLIPDSDAISPTTAGIGLLTLLAFAGLAFYSRLDEEEVLAHDTRQRIRALVEAEPGIHANAIARRVDANDHTVEHHLDVLVREDVVSVLERGGYNHHFVRGQHTPKEMQALASLQRGQAEAVYETVRQDPGLDLSSLADRADISKAYASKLVDELVDVGLVDRVREGRRARLYANDV